MSPLMDPVPLKLHGLRYVLIEKYPLGKRHSFIVQGDIGTKT